MRQFAPDPPVAHQLMWKEGVEAGADDVDDDYAVCRVEADHGRVGDPDALGCQGGEGGGEGEVVGGEGDEGGGGVGDGEGGDGEEMGGGEEDGEEAHGVLEDGRGAFES